jgi:hypothetical protein
MYDPYWPQTRAVLNRMALGSRPIVLITPPGPKPPSSVRTRTPQQGGAVSRPRPSISAASIAVGARLCQRRIDRALGYHQ